MTITLASLVARLTADVPAVSGVPTTAQYEQAVKDAVADLSRRASVPRVTTLATVAGTASYALPSDFQRIIRLAAIGVPFGSSYLEPGVYPGGPWDSELRGGTIVAPSGLIPFAGSSREQITVTGDTLTIYPTPQTSADRSLVYAAGDSLNDAGDAYPTLSEDRAQIALLLARATCLERVASSAGGQTGRVAGLGFEVDTRAAGADRRQQASDARAQYLAAVQSLTSGTGGLA